MKSFLLCLCFLFSSQLYSSFAYIVLSSANRVVVLDTTTNTVIATIPTSTSPSCIAAAPDGTLVYVGCSNAFNVIETATNRVIATVATPGTGTLGAVATAALDTGTFVYFMSGSSDSILVVNSANNTVVATIPVSDAPNDIATSSAAGVAYVTSINADTINVIDLATNTVVDNIAAMNPRGSAFNHVGTLAYVVASSMIFVIDTATNTIITTLAFGPPSPGFFAPAVSPDDTLVYVVGNISNSVFAFNTATNTLIATIPTGGVTSPQDVAFTPDGTLAYVANGNSTFVNVINVATNSVIATAAVGGFSSDLVILDVIQDNVKGQQVNNKFLTQSDLVNVITWSAPPGFTPVSYQVFRDSSLTDLAATVSPSEELRFEDHNRRKNQTYRYFVVAINQSGTRLSLGSVTLPTN